MRPSYCRNQQDGGLNSFWFSFAISCHSCCIRVAEFATSIGCSKHQIPSYSQPIKLATRLYGDLVKTKKTIWKGPVFLKRVSSSVPARKDIQPDSTNVPQASRPVISKLISSHVGGELKDYLDEGVKIVVDVVVVGRDDLPTEVKLVAANKYA